MGGGKGEGNLAGAVIVIIPTFQVQGEQAL